MNSVDEFRTSTAYQYELIRRAEQLVASRRVEVEQTEAALSSGTSTARQAHERDLQALTEKFEAESERLDADYFRGLEQARHRYETEVMTLEQKLEKERDSASKQLVEATSRVEDTFQQTKSITNDSFEADTRMSEDVFRQVSGAVKGCAEQLEWLEDEAAKLARKRGGSAYQLTSPTIDEPLSTGQLLDRYSHSAKQAYEFLQTLRQWPLARFIDDGWPVVIFIFTTIVSTILAGIALGWTTWLWVAVALGTSSVLSLGSRQVAYYALQRRSQAGLGGLAKLISDCQVTVKAAEVAAKDEHQQRERKLEKRRENELYQAEKTWKRITRDIKSEHNAKTGTAKTAVETRRQELEAAWESEAGPFREKYPPLIEKCRQQFGSDCQALDDRLKRALDELNDAHARGWSELASRWIEGMGEVVGEFKRIGDTCRDERLIYRDVDWESWQPLARGANTAQIGTYQFDLSRFEGGVPEDERLALLQTQFELPVAMAFPESPSLLIEAADEGRDQAVQVLQSAMLRLLTSLPAGKVRFTIIDPTGLGQNFSAFMHLADFDERLVTSRIWTETSHINQRLLDLTEHMENVIQKYLRNEFSSIQEYNEYAGEVAEPFQVLVIANFPVNFSEEAARRLVSIAISGSRCGVYTLISVDSKMKTPRNFDLADLRAHANTLRCENGRMVWEDEYFRTCPLELESPPPEETTTRIIRAAGQLATDANRVEVPFATVVPTEDQWWSFDSGDELRVPLGRAGATKLQYLELGKGTAQHVLVAGKTGSGKSTLMHAMITNLAIHYSPHEVEFFLIDFKKGVEFKPYAEMGLPHARVIAIESEREFGLSVLQRLDEELRRRGDKFRDCGVQGVRAFREARPNEPLPRMLLMVDEFQEFFVKDDKIAQDASLLLDRLVRQGRAFGIHVILGSQTLAGAYSLARSTIGQMAVRIALQCSEADSHLILSEENTAARLLGRPGEAIYNNANGLFEGNHPFQVVWLSDAQRENYLRCVADLARSRQIDVEPAIVFEGNVAADPSDNHALCHQLRVGTAADSEAPGRAWLGSAIEIKDPTEVVFRRQGGSHLLVVGQQEEMAMGIFSNVMISLAASTSKVGDPSTGTGPRFRLLDGGNFESTASSMTVIATKYLGLDCRVALPGECEEVMASLAEEVTRRVDERDESSPPIFLVAYNLPRFRELRKSDDDFGLSGFGEESAASPAKNLTHILRDGAAVGVHALIWCDTYNNVTRWLDRQTLRDIAFRVLFQMSATDSSNLMDSAAASRLGVHRAILYNDERGEHEKFRPYGPPSTQWLKWARAELEKPPASANTDSDGNPSELTA